MEALKNARRTAPMHAPIARHLRDFPSTRPPRSIRRMPGNPERVGAQETRRHIEQSPHFGRRQRAHRRASPNQAREPAPLHRHSPKPGSCAALRSDPDRIHRHQNGRPPMLRSRVNMRTGSRKSAFLAEVARHFDDDHHHHRSWTAGSRADRPRYQDPSTVRWCPVCRRRRSFRPHSRSHLTAAHR